MELISNLVWAAVALVLWGTWCARPWGFHARCKQPGAGLELFALVMLTAILLPVISVSDDLQACQNPAEVERSIRNADAIRALHSTSPDSPLAAATLLSSVNQPRVAVKTPLPADSQIPGQTIEDLERLWTRPPPTVA